MCGRFTQHYTWSEVHEFLNVFGEPQNLRPRYNIAPTTQIEVVRPAAEGWRELTRMRWGLVPGWWNKPLKELLATFNARAETVAEKPMFRGAFKARRCIIPASGFYEWTGPTGGKIPHLFTASDASPILAMAGLWEAWRTPEGETVPTCAIIVGAASSWMEQYHDRMPVLLRPDQFDHWLSGAMGADELQPVSHEALREWPVTARLNKSGYGDDDPSMIEAQWNVD